ncbi:uncharacterized protein K444DRAFT_709185 [Hyaloscypha bicolor E]|uniref:Uncharacterized protein n=1 Tax=Hyaloscypha bicolor E TaxID=1095630 RepID=A0A2J6SN38_9HELO|nr:uncharacterized protein K444DRAFT_709185 [Hyaloscypha bicolor E]PMD52186.1 hypothetical protein K444DRAFT_709185 [Hyaloscypha bicolor E]
MALELYIPPCISSSAHPLYPLPPEQPLRIQIEGPLVSIQKLLPEILWHTNAVSLVFLQPAGPGLAGLAYQKIYGRNVTFDHLINIIEIDNDGGVYANEYLPFPVDPVEYIGKKVLAVPRCYQKRKGIQDCERVNGSVAERDREMKET